MVIKMVTKLGRRMNKPSENFNKEKENIKKNQSELNTITKMKNILKGINSKVDDAEQNRHLKGRVVEITPDEQQKENN